MVVAALVGGVGRLAPMRLMTPKNIVILIGILLNVFVLYVVRRILLGGTRGGTGKRTHGTSSGSRGHKSSRKKHGKGRKDAMKKNSDPNLLLLLGIPGSGKTTWMNQYLEHCNHSYVVVNDESVRAKLIGENGGPPGEETVREAVISDVVRHLKNGQSVAVDHSLFVMDKAFRGGLVEAAPSCNQLVKEFPIKALFAHLRLLKEVEKGTRRTCPTEIELEEMENDFNQAKTTMTEEGWKPLLAVLSK